MACSWASCLSIGSAAPCCAHPIPTPHKTLYTPQNNAIFQSCRLHHVNRNDQKTGCLLRKQPCDARRSWRGGTPYGIGTCIEAQGRNLQICCGVSHVCVLSTPASGEDERERRRQPEIRQLRLSRARPATPCVLTEHPQHWERVRPACREQFAEDWGRGEIGKESEDKRLATQDGA